MMTDRITSVAADMALREQLLDIEDVQDVEDHVQHLLNYYKLQTVCGWETTPAQWVAVKAIEWRNPSIYLYRMFDDDFARDKPAHVLFMFSQAILRACEDNTYSRSWWTQPRQFSTDDLELQTWS